MLYKTSFHKIIGAIALIFLVACTSPTPVPSDRPQAAIPLEACQISTPNGNIRLEAKCGKLVVYEDRQTNTGRQIELNIAVIPAVSRNPTPDPIFFIPGGPGEAATQSFPVLMGAFEQINQKRDIVLVDQRGTGGSHSLRCQAEDSGQNGQTDTAEYLKSCLAALDANPRLYTTSIAMDDLEQVRQALGYEKINLYGASYGTRAALVYLRQYPNSVRTIILDGVAPTNWSIGPSVASDGQRALDLIFSRCAASSDCLAAFPDLKDEFQSVINDLQDQSIEVTLDHPITGETTTFQLTLDDFASTIHTMSYAPETAALIPLMVSNAFSHQDFRPLAAQFLSTTETLGTSISGGMRFSIICAEDVPFYNETTMTEGYLGDYIVESFREICRTWPQGQIPAGYKEPVSSNIPVLLISGEADPVTPPNNAEMAAKTLPNSLQLVIPDMGHVNIFRGCVPKLATAFIESGSIQGLDTGCVEKTIPMPFFLNLSGPHP